MSVPNKCFNEGHKPSLQNLFIDAFKGNHNQTNIKLLALCLIAKTSKTLTLAAGSLKHYNNVYNMHRIN